MSWRELGLPFIPVNYRNSPNPAIKSVHPPQPPNGPTEPQYSSEPLQLTASWHGGRCLGLYWWYWRGAQQFWSLQNVLKPTVTYSTSTQEQSIDGNKAKVPRTGAQTTTVSASSCACGLEESKDQSPMSSNVLLLHPRTQLGSCSGARDRCHGRTVLIYIWIWGNKWDKVCLRLSSHPGAQAHRGPW